MLAKPLSPSTIPNSHGIQPDLALFLDTRTINLEQFLIYFRKTSAASIEGISFSQSSPLSEYEDAPKSFIKSQTPSI